MEHTKEKIRTADPEQIQELLAAVLNRYGEMYPDWQISVVSLEKKENRNGQLDDMIRLLQNMKK